MKAHVNRFSDFIEQLNLNVSISRTAEGDVHVTGVHTGSAHMATLNVAIVRFCYQNSPTESCNMFLNTSMAQ